jgi:hypothetical protein
MIINNILNYEKSLGGARLLGLIALIGMVVIFFIFDRGKELPKIGIATG